MKSSNNLWLYLFKNNQSAFFKNQEVQANIPYRNEHKVSDDACSETEDVFCDMAWEVVVSHLLISIALGFFAWRHFF